MQNIGADNAGDAFYRYKMPKLVAKVCGLPVWRMRVLCVRNPVSSFANLFCESGLDAEVSLRLGAGAPARASARAAGPEASVSCVSVQVEGRGNGIRTNIVNNVDIARALDRPPTCAPSAATCTSVHACHASHSPPGDFDCTKCA